MVSHCTAPQAQNKQSLQNWSRRHIGSLWQTQISLSSFTVVLKGNQSISFSAKLHISNSTVSIFESLQWETSKGDPWTTEPTPGFWPAACEWEISQGICTALLLISPLFSCSRGCPRGERLPVRPKEAGWCEDLRGVVTFPLPEAHPCSARPAAHAPRAPHAPVPVHVLRDGGFTDTLPSSAPLQGNHVSIAWGEALTLHRWALKDVWGIATSPRLSF